jgi:predicted Zn-dependent peptidase
VQADATAEAADELLRECRDLARDSAIGDDELAQAKASLTRGYARHFETAAQLVRAMIQMVAYELDDDVFDRFVPAVDQLTAPDVARAARVALRPDQAAVIVVGDLGRIGRTLETLGRDVAPIDIEF